MQPSKSPVGLAMLSLQQTSAEDVKEERARARRKRQRWRLRFQSEASNEGSSQATAQEGSGNFCIHIIDPPEVNHPSRRISQDCKEPRSNSFASEVACSIANFMVSREFLAMLPLGSLDRRSVAVMGKDGTVSGLAMAMIGARVLFCGDSRNAAGVRANVNSYFKETPDYTGRKSPHVAVAAGPVGRSKPLDVTDLCEPLGMPPPLDLILVTDGPGVLGLDERLWDFQEDTDSFTAPGTPMGKTLSYGARGESILTLRQSQRATMGNMSMGHASSLGRESVNEKPPETQSSTFRRLRKEDIEKKREKESADYAAKEHAAQARARERAMQRLLLLLKLLESAVPENASTRILFARNPIKDFEMTSFELPCGPGAHWHIQLLRNLMPVVELFAIERVERPCGKEGLQLRKKVYDELELLSAMQPPSLPTSLGGSHQSSMQDLHAMVPSPRPLTGILGNLKIQSRPQTSDSSSLNTSQEWSAMSARSEPTWYSGIADTTLRGGVLNHTHPSSRPGTSDRSLRPVVTQQQRREALQASLMQNNAELKDHNMIIVHETDHWRQEKNGLLHAIQKQNEMIKGLQNELARPMEPALCCPAMPPNLALRQGKPLSIAEPERRESSGGPPPGLRKSPRRGAEQGDPRSPRGPVAERNRRTAKWGKSRVLRSFLELGKIS
eukprot:gnl/MRDRNA2_/MRDRNA2_128007_c0_seq1.p1 gnl/MRDRNA2_/MRDRNA2_128007_c0~~gnl/MRDRNA2_/MRDRNA2_128007_c0_seq1.p1  ORF type:complete len:670 (+),score=111.18 gnl/MRDRNA2_/MRDRNA2_128007_c0_seq1:78-2087(+)